MISAGVAAVGVPVLQACGGPAAQPTTAPAAPKDAAPTTAAKQEAPKETAKAAEPKTATGPAPKMSIALQVGADTQWQVNASEKFAQENSVDLEIIQVPGDEMAKKLLTMLATNTLSDVAYSGVKYFRYTAYKGAFMALDDMVKTNDPGLDDFFQSSIESCKFDGKLYALPIEINTGNQNIILYNKDMLAEKGVPEPTDEWTFEDFATGAATLTDQGANVFGTNLLPTNYYDLVTYARSLGGDILSEDGKEFTLATDPKTLEATRWVTELRTKHQAAPARTQTEGLAFPAGQIGFFATGIYSMVSIPLTIGDKFQWDAVLAPVGPEGLRGYELFTVMFSVSAKTQQPDLSYGLLTTLTSEETGMAAFVEEGNPMPRRSIWESPEAQNISTIFQRASDWLSDGKNEGEFPMPYNLRFAELQDKFGNLIQPIFYGETEFDAGIQNVQAECQKIVELERG